MLHAAAVAGATMREAREWVINPLSREPMSILESCAADPDWAANSPRCSPTAATTSARSSPRRGPRSRWMNDRVMDAAACPRPVEGSPRGTSPARPTACT